MKKKLLLYSPQDKLTWADDTSLEADPCGSQGWSVLRLRELRAESRQRVSAVDLECLSPSEEPQSSDTGRRNEETGINTYTLACTK